MTENSDNTLDRPTAYQTLGGEAAVRALVDRFYARMEEPAYATIRAMHQDMARAREHLFLFLSGWLGGPDLFVERFGHPRLRQRHLPFAIGIAERDQWLACMFLALQDINCPDELRQRLEKNFAHTADFMRNREG